MLRIRIVFIAFLVVSTGLAGAQVTIIRIADATTSFPGDLTMVSFDEPAIAGGRVAFSAAGPPGGGRGVFLWENETISAVAVAGTQIPGTSLSFATLGPRVSVSSDAVVFDGGAPGAGGLYVSSGGVIVPIADETEPLPGVVGVPSAFAGVGRYSSQQVGFTANGSVSEQGVFMGDGENVDLIADTATVIPGVGLPFFSFGRVSSDGSGVAFLGRYPVGGGNTGVYMDLGSGLIPVVTPGVTPIPDLGGAFARIGDVAIVGHAVRFTGGSGTLDHTFGLFEYHDGVCQTLVGVGCNVPESDASFWHMEQISADGPDTIFNGWGTVNPSGSNGIYLHRGGTVSKIVGESFEIAGQTVNLARIGHLAVSGHRVAFLGQGPSGNGVYLADYSGLMPCSDITCDGTVDLSDLASLLSNFGLTAGNSILGDLDGDGAIALPDLAALLAQFGGSCP